MVDLSVVRGRLVLANPVLTAAGCGGYGMELAAALPLWRLGAHVVKSLTTVATGGNPAPRLAPVPAGMLNSVGLAGPGIDRWLTETWPTLADANVPVSLSVWGRRHGDYAETVRRAARIAGSLVSIELNLSCPNLEADRRLFAHDPDATANVVTAVRSEVDVPILVKLSANTDRIVEVAEAAVAAGADGLVAINTLFAQWYDDGHEALGTARGGGLSGRAIQPIALRAVADLRAALPTVPIIGVGGVATADDVERFVCAGADAVQIGTALFVDPRRPILVLAEIERRLGRIGVDSWDGYVRALRRPGGSG